MGKTKNLIFYFHSWLELCYFCILSVGFIVKNIITSFHWLHLNNYTHYENKCLNPKKQNNCVAFFTCVNSVYVDVSQSSNGWAEFLAEPMKFLVDMLNHAH